MMTNVYEKFYPTNFFSPIQLFLLVTLFAFPNVDGVVSSRILMVGDSMAEFMGQALESFCANSKVYNAGIGGTTAQQWSSYSKDDLPSECGMGSWDVVYISVGGNDMLNSGCSMTSSELKDRIENAITNVVNNLAPGASKYVLTGYCMPSQPEEDSNSAGGCNTPADFLAISDAFNDISSQSLGLSNSSLVINDSISLCGGSKSSFSDFQYFQDSIHLNAKGYCNVFSQPSIQSGLLCDASEEETDCASLNGNELYGLEENCYSDNAAGKIRVSCTLKFLTFTSSLLFLYLFH